MELLFIILLAISGIYDNYETVAGDTILLDGYSEDVTLGKDNRAYVLTLGSEKFSVIIIENNTKIEKMQFNRDFGQPTNIQVDTDNEILYIGNYNPPSLSVYDLETKELIRNIELDSCPNSSLSKFYFNQKTNTLYFLIHGIQNENTKECSNSYSGIRILDGKTFTIIPNLTNSFNIHTLLFDSEKNSIFALYNFKSEIDVIDYQNNQIIDTINLVEKIDYENTYDEKSGKIFGHYNGTITITDINIPENIKKIKIPNYDGQQIRLIVGNNQLFIISDNYYTSEFSGKNGYLIIFDPNEETFSKKIKIGQRPIHYALDQELGILYTVNSQSDSITIIDIENRNVVNSIESFRFEIVSIIVILITIIMLIIIFKNNASKNRSWLIGGLASVYGIYLPWSYQFFLRLDSGGSVSIFDTIIIPIWPFAVAFPLSFSIMYYVFLLTRFKKIRNAISEVYYFPKKMVVEIFYDESHLSKISFVIIAVITSALIYEMVQQVTLQDFFNSLPASDILGIVTIPETINESPAISLFTTPLLQIFLAGLGGFWLVFLRRLWNLEWNKILKFGELNPQDKTLKEPTMKFRGSRSLVLFLYFAFFFNLSIMLLQIGSEPSQEWTRSPVYYSIIHFTAFIIPTTLTIFFFEKLVFPLFAKKDNREI